MAYGHRKDIQDKANMERSTNMVTKSRFKPVYHYNLKSSTQEDFNNTLNANKGNKRIVQLSPLRRSIGQLTPSNVLTIKGYYDIKGRGLQALRCRVYSNAKAMNIHVETAFSQEKQALLVRLKRNWPVGVDKT